MSVTVTSSQQIKEHNGKPIYKIGFSDGTFAESYAVAIPTGTKADDLDITEGQYGRKVKKKTTGFGGGKREPNNAAFSMAYAKDLVVAGKIELNQMSTYADKMFAWMESKKS